MQDDDAEILYYFTVLLVYSGRNLTIKLLAEETRTIHITHFVEVASAHDSSALDKEYNTSHGKRIKGRIS